MPWMRNLLVRKSYSTIMGMCFGFYSYGCEFWVFIIYVMMGWCVQKFLPMHIATKALMGIFFTLLLMRSLYGLCLGNNSDVCVKTGMMMAYLKMHYIAISMRDAAVLRSGKEHKLSEREVWYAQPLLDGKPVPLATWVQYMFFMGNVTWGPPIEYRNFVDFIDLKENYGKMRPGSHLIPAFSRYGQSLLCLAFTVWFGMVVDVDEIRNPAMYYQPFWYRMGYIILCMQKNISTLFTGFMWMESQIVASGQGYSVDKDGKEEWNTYPQVSAIGFWVSTNTTDATQKWNIQTHRWLKYYVLARLRDRSKPRGYISISVVLITYLTSATWHGVDLGYIYFFIYLGLGDILVRVGK